MRRIEVTMTEILFGNLFSTILNVMMITSWILNSSKKVLHPERSMPYSLCTVAMPTLPIKEILRISQVSSQHKSA
jgi:hypothetical protein